MRTSGIGASTPIRPCSVARSTSTDRAVHDHWRDAARFRGLTGRADLWMTIGARRPFMFDPKEAWDHEFSMVARLAPGVAVGARAEATSWCSAPVSNAAYPLEATHGRVGRDGAAPRPNARRSQSCAARCSCCSAPRSSFCSSRAPISRISFSCARRHVSGRSPCGWPSARRGGDS